MSDVEYLSSAIVKNDHWVKSVCTTESDEELAVLFINRIMFPGSNGPVIAYTPSADDMCSEQAGDIIVDLYINCFIDFDIAQRAMAIVMAKINAKKINTSDNFLSNVFHIIGELSISDCSDELYKWLNDNASYVSSPNPGNRLMYKRALEAFVFAQNTTDNDDIVGFWKSLWNHQSDYWWGVAFSGLRFADHDYALSILPQYIDRNCSNLASTLVAMWRNYKKDDKLQFFLKKGINDNEDWAGIAVNLIAMKMKFVEKTNLLETLRRSDEHIEDEQEAVNDAMITV